MIVAELDSRTVSRIRLSPSPLADGVALLRLAAAGRSDPVFGDAGAAARAALTDPDVSLLTHVMPPGGRGYVPDLLTPKPTGTGDVESQLEQVRATPDEIVHQHVAIERFGGADMPRTVARAVSDGSFARRAARGLTLFWRATLRDAWRELSEVTSADIVRRSQQLGRHGIAHLLGSLHPDIDYDGRALRIRLPPWDERGRFEDTELVLSPALFGWPGISPQLCRADQAVLRYPAHSLGTRIHGTPRRALAALIGTTRSRLLTDLSAPRSTTELGTRLGLAPATVSYHLGILADCGLLVRSRAGHTVRYARSPRADALLG